MHCSFAVSQENTKRTAHWQLKDYQHNTAIYSNMQHSTAASAATVIRHLTALTLTCNFQKHKFR